MRSLSAPLLFFILILSTACSRVPVPVSYPQQPQQKMQAAHHWDVLANDLAYQINNELIRRDYLEIPVYVNHSCGEPAGCSGEGTFPFDEGFNDLLVSQLVNFGVPTVATPDERAVVVDYKVQVIYHRNGYLQIAPGSLTALTAAILVFHNAPWEARSMVVGAIADAMGSMMVVNGQYEVIISTSIVKDNVYLLRKSNIYYINDADFWQYRPRQNSGTEIKLTGSH